MESEQAEVMRSESPWWARVDWAERASWLALGLCTSAAIALRFYAIGRLPGINGDEPQYAVHAHSFFAGAPLWSLRTGSDLPMNPVFFGMVLLVQKLFPTTLWSLRLSAALLSVVTIFFAWALFRQRGRTFATTFACLVAVLPIHLGYARFAWDPTAIPTASVLALAASSSKRPVLCLCAFALCLWVHPTCVFLLPTLLAPFLARYWPRTALGEWSWSRERVWGVAALLVGVPLAAAIVVPFGLKHELFPGAVSNVLRGDLPSRVWQRAQDPAGLWRFLLAYAELLSGPTIYRYIIGSLSSRAAELHLWASCSVLPLLAAGLHSAKARGRSVDLAVAVGLCLSLLCLYLLAGPVALAPKTERYAVCLTVPACYVLSACVDALATSDSRARALRAAVSVVGGALLLSFSTLYLQQLRHPDPQREDTFRTGAKEPKAQALRAVAQMRDPDRTAVIYVEDWWIYWTLRYLAPPESNPPTRLTIYEQAWDYRFPNDFKPPEYDPDRMQLFGIAWAGHPLDGRFAALANAQRDIFGYKSGPILRVYELRSLEPRKRHKKRK